MASDLYQADFYLWTQDQAEALRAREGGHNRLDYERLAEEVADLGSSELNKCRSWIVRIIEHLQKLETSRALDPRSHWKSEVRNWRVDLGFVMTRSMRRLVEEELGDLHAKGARNAQKKLDLHEIGLTVDGSRQWTLAEILGENDDPLDKPTPGRDQD